MGFRACPYIYIYILPHVILKDRWLMGHAKTCQWLLLVKIIPKQTLNCLVLGNIHVYRFVISLSISLLKSSTF